MFAYSCQIQFVGRVKSSFIMPWDVAAPGHIILVFSYILRAVTVCSESCYTCDSLTSA